MSLSARLMENPLAYRLWQAPFADEKFAPVVANNDIGRVRRVLDVGCGPGTNSRHFLHADYLGIDINPDYIRYARRRFPGKFLVADVTTYTAPPDERFDFILLNSFLHHIDRENVTRVLLHLSTLLTQDGHVNIVELVLPARRSVARQLAAWDRGRFARSFEEWQEIFAGIFCPVVYAPFSLIRLGVSLWEMIYFKGAAKR